MIERQNLFPEALSKRVVGGHVLYSPVVTVVGGKLVFVSGLLARNQAGEIVGKGDMAAQIRQVGENLKAALAATGATLADLVRTQTFTTDIDEFFKHVGVRMEYFAGAAHQHHRRGAPPLASGFSCRGRGDCRCGDCVVC